jgi:lysozyme
MPAKRKKLPSILSTAIWLTGIVAAIGLVYIFSLWWQYRSTGFVRYDEFGIPIPTQYAIHGIDVSHYQQKINWDRVVSMQVDGIKIEFAFIKATEGLSRVDPYFRRNWKQAKASGIKKGAYHFFIASKDGTAQAKNFIRTVKIEPGDLPPVLDVEQTFGVSRTVLRREVKEWLDAVEIKYKVRPIIYTGADFYAQNLKGHFEDYPLWVAHYLQPHRPRVSREWHFWQHSERGRVDGIYAYVDFNVFNGDSTRFRSLLVP